jgi:prepilin-type N-terminal cleavage/methylation domain-containing protein
MVSTLTKNVSGVSKRCTGATPGAARAARGFPPKTRLRGAMARALLRCWSMIATVRSSKHGTRALARRAARGSVNAAGFTLIELMVVVVIMGVLAALATYGVRKYVLEAKKAEATNMLTQIRAAEEAYRDETFQYLGLDTFVWHPVDAPGGAKYGWDFADTAMRTEVFDPLGVMPNGLVEYSYAVVAGAAGGSLPLIPTERDFDFPTPTGPFYIAMAKADLDNDGRFTYAIVHSDTSAIHFDEHF